VPHPLEALVNGRFRYAEVSGGIRLRVAGFEEAALHPKPNYPAHNSPRIDILITGWSVSTIRPPTVKHQPILDNTIADPIREQIDEIRTGRHSTAWQDG
jgi:hypothetical protein